MSVNIQDAYRTSNRVDQKKKTLPQYNNQDTKCRKKARILKDRIDKSQETYRIRPIRIVPDF